MDEENFQVLKNIYKDFQKKLYENINNSEKSSFTQQSEDCYLVDEIWINDFLKCFNKDNINNKNNFNISSSLFINDFPNIISSLNNFKKLRLVNKQLIDSFTIKNDLKDLSIIQYYGGNNKIIIEYKNKKDNKALLLLNPLDDNIMKYKAFILSVSNKDKLFLYRDLLSEKDNSNITSRKKYQNFVISFANYINNSNNASIKRINKESISPQKKKKSKCK